MTFECLHWSIAFWPPFQAVYIGYTYHINILFLSIVFRMSEEYMEKIDYDHF